MVKSALVVFGSLSGLAFGLVILFAGRESTVPWSELAARLPWEAVSGNAKGGEQWLWAKSEKLAQASSKSANSNDARSKALAKVIAAAKAAAEHDTSKIREADAALRLSQKQLGRNAVHLHLLSDSQDQGTSSDDSVFQVDSASDLSDNDMRSLIEDSKKDKLAMPALAAAEKAAAKNRDAMKNAQEIIRQSEAVLGPKAAKELYSLPSLAYHSQKQKLAVHDQDLKFGVSKPNVIEPETWQQEMRAQREEHSFIRATKFAREMP